MKTLEAKYFLIAIVATAVLSSTVTMSALHVTSDNIKTVSSSQVLGHVTAIVSDSDGNIKAYRQSDNMIVTAGMQEIADNLFFGINATSAKMRYIDIGSSSTAAAPGQTTLVAAIGGACARDDASDATPALPSYVAGTMNGASNANVTLSARFTGANCANGSIQEAGLFNAATGGQMFARTLFSPVNLLASDQLDLTWTFQFTDT